MVSDSDQEVALGVVELECGETVSVRAFALGSEKEREAIGDLARTCEAAKRKVKKSDCDAFPPELEEVATADAIASCNRDALRTVLCVDADGNDTKDCKPQNIAENCALSDKVQNAAKIAFNCKSHVLDGQTVYQAQCEYSSFARAEGRNKVGCVACEEESGEGEAGQGQGDAENAGDGEGEGEGDDGSRDEDASSQESK